MSRISAGEAYVSVSVDNKNLINGLKEASQRIQSTSQTFSQSSKALNPTIGIGGADAFKASLQEIRREAELTERTAKKLSDRFVITAGDIYNAVRSAARGLTSLLGGVGDEFDKMSARTGLSSEALSEFAHAAEMSGASISDVEGAMRSLASQIVAAQSGSSRAEKAFQILGVSVEQIAALNPERQFDAIARAISAISDPTERAGAAMRIFGAAGANLIPLFSQGPDGLAKLRQEARDLGVSVDSTTAKMGANFQDATTRLKSAFQGLGLTIARAVTPALIDFANVASRALSAVIKLAEEHPNLTLGLTAATAAAGALASSVFIATNAWTVMTGAVASVQKALTALNLTSLANPWVLLAAAIGAAVAAVIAYRKAVSDLPKFSKDAANDLEEQRSQDQQARADLDRLRTLQKISREHQLSNEEIGEAARLAESLKQKYGDVGVSVDAVAGSIKIAVGAQKELNDKINEGRRLKLQAAIDEARNNEESGALERDVLRDEVGTAEMLFGKKRGATWGQYIAEMLGGVNPNGSVVAKGIGDDARREILGDDADFQKRLSIAKRKNQAQIAEWQAELDALTVSAATSAADAAGGAVDERALQAASDAAAKFIDEGTEKEKSALDRKIDAIKERRERVIEELRRLADPEGLTDWNDQSSVDELFRSSPQARAIQQQALNVDAAANQQIALAQQEAQAEAQREAQRQIEEQRRAAEEEAERKRKGDEELAEAMKARAEKYASPLEKLAMAAADLQEAQQSLVEAQTGGDSATIAAALNRLGAAEDKYASAEELAAEARDNIGRSVGGTFNAWQASSVASLDFNKQTLREQRTQTGYLRQIADAARRGGGAVFA